MKWNFWNFDPIFRKFDQKTLKSEKKLNFRKNDFWCQKRASRAKITTGCYFLAKNQRKNGIFKMSKFLRTSHFFNIRQNRDWLRGLPLKTVPTLNRRKWWCSPLEIHPEPERFGQVDFDDITKRPNFMRSYLYFERKSYQPFLFLTGGQPQIGLRKLLWAANTWPSLTACREAKLLTELGGRCFCIRYPVGRGRGPARF